MKKKITLQLHANAFFGARIDFEYHWLEQVIELEKVSYGIAFV